VARSTLVALFPTVLPLALCITRPLLVLLAAGLVLLVLTLTLLVLALRLVLLVLTLALLALALALALVLLVLTLTLTLALALALALVLLVLALLALALILLVLLLALVLVLVLVLAHVLLPNPAGGVAGGRDVRPRLCDMDEISRSGIQFDECICEPRHTICRSAGTGRHLAIIGTTRFHSPSPPERAPISARHHSQSGRQHPLVISAKAVSHARSSSSPEQASISLVITARAGANIRSSSPIGSHIRSSSSPEQVSISARHPRERGDPLTLILGF
jgi:hypothetical protein